MTARTELEMLKAQLTELRFDLTSALVRALELREPRTASHGLEVARYARELARRMGLSEARQALVHTAALLHDIGKLMLSDRILAGEVPLGEEDWQLIRMHPHEGARVVSGLEGYGEVADIVVAHHERLDGLGYPWGLEGEEIPIEARIISVPDCYDAMTARQSYRDPVSSGQALTELERVAGSQLDPDAVEVFGNLLAEDTPGSSRLDEVLGWKEPRREANCRWPAGRQDLAD